MNQIDFEKIATISDRGSKNINEIIDEIDSGIIDRDYCKLIIKDVIKNERLNAAIAMQEYYLYNKRCNL